MNNLEIRLCDKCNGHGRLKVDDRYSDIDSVECNTCEGKGRVYYRTYELSVPLTQENKMYRLDEEITKIIRYREDGWIKPKNYSEVIKNIPCFVYTDKGNIYEHGMYMRYSSICETEDVLYYKPILIPEPPCQS